MRVAVICSAGGSAFLDTADACPHVEFFLITDRGVQRGGWVPRSWDPLVNE